MDKNDQILKALSIATSNLEEDNKSKTNPFKPMVYTEDETAKQADLQISDAERILNEALELLGGSGSNTKDPEFSWKQTDRRKGKSDPGSYNGKLSDSGTVTMPAVTKDGVSTKAVSFFELLPKADETGSAQKTWEPLPPEPTRRMEKMRSKEDEESLTAVLKNDGTVPLREDGARRYDLMPEETDEATVPLKHAVIRPEDASRPKDDPGEVTDTVTGEETSGSDAADKGTVSVKKRVFRIVSRILIVIACAFIIHMCFGLVRVDGASMMETYESGDILLRTYPLNISRGDVVIFTSDFWGDERTLIKRVIATEGDSIYCEDGVVYLNGEALTEDYAYGETDDFAEFTVSEDCVFVMGDNRENSTDSRIFGQVSTDDITGKASEFVISDIPENIKEKISNRG